MTLKKIDPTNPPQFKKQMLFYNVDYKMFRLGEVDFIRIDTFGTRIVYKSFESIKVYDGVNNPVIFNFEPTHYLDIDLSQIKIE